MKKLRLLLFPLSAILLTSCIVFENIFPPSSSSSEKAKEPYIFPSTDNTYISPEVDPEKNYYKVGANPYNNKVIGDSKDLNFLKSLGEQKLLVIPVSFTDSGEKYADEELIKTNITNAFFGASNETGWESVSTFYQKSSYGKLNLTGEVSDVFHSTYTKSKLENMATDDDYWDQSHYVLEEIYNTIPAQKLRDYDTDKDGFVDAVFFVYLAPIGSDLFWAFQYHWNVEKSEVKPPFSIYAWASYDFMYEDETYAKDKPAAHTYIHETGHMFGLDDYYDYDRQSAPLGGIDMMDNNIVDHNMYSKYVLNWTTPYVPVGDAEIFLPPSQNSGDFILINNNWNGHAYDEYIMIDYYTPTGLNEHDSQGLGYGKAPKKTKAFSESGVRIYHVDSRIVEMRAKNQDEVYPYRYRDTLTPSNEYFYYDYVASNTPTTSHFPTFKRIHLLDALGRTRTWYHTEALTGDNVLFKTGQEIKSNEWGKYLFTGNTFNDKSAIGYSILIGEMSEEGVNIKLIAA